MPRRAGGTRHRSVRQREHEHSRHWFHGSKRGTWRHARSWQEGPAFTLESSDGGKVKLSDLAGKIVVLYFYPRDNTPGCTVEANDFNAALPAFKKLGAVVLGASKHSIATHCMLRDKFDLAFPLLSDPDGKVLEADGAWGDKVMYGTKMKGIIRSV